MIRRRTRARGDVGLIALPVIATAVVVLLAGGLVHRVAWTAESINKKAGNIAKTAAPINLATRSVAEGNLDTTNQLAGSILETAKPLEGKLAEIVRLAQSVDALASSINATAGEVDTTAAGIDRTATEIVEVARSIDRGVVQINRNLDVTIALAGQIKGDTANILNQARIAHRLASCIDQGLPGGLSDGHCRREARS